MDNCGWARFVAAGYVYYCMLVRSSLNYYTSFVFQKKRLAIGIHETIYRTHDNATGLVIIAHAFIAFVGIDFINVITFRDCPGRAFLLTKATVDAIIRNG